MQPEQPCRVENNMTPLNGVVIVNRNETSQQVLSKLNAKGQRAALVRMNNSRSNNIGIANTGIVSVTDLLYADDNDPVGELSHESISIEYDQLMTRAKREMRENDISQLVVTEGEKVVGIIWDYQAAQGCS